tara:strand:- start:134909 stop:135082 length:174 start_codon:yes stop_codon:yes gene_type:complete
MIWDEDMGKVAEFVDAFFFCEVWGVLSIGSIGFVDFYFSKEVFENDSCSPEGGTAMG